MAMEEMNLQLFAETEITEPVMESAESDAQEIQTSAPETEPAIPEELAGVSPDIAREIMKEAESQAKDETPAAEENQPPKNELETTGDDTEVDADADSDNKPVEDNVLETPKQPIPYARFKQVNDKLKAAEKQLKEMQEQREKAKATPAQRPAQPMQPVVPAPNSPVQSFTLTPEMARQIDAAAKVEALKMTGMTQEDVDNLKYADDDDTKQQTWNTAVAMSRNMILGQIQQEAQRQQQRQATFMQQHQQLMQQYQDFANKEMQADDFAAVQQFAVNDFFQTKSPTEQQIIGNAYARIERNVASPAEVYSVVNYFKEAKEAYQKAQEQVKAQEQLKATPAKPDITKTKQKIAEANKQPRSQQIEGAASTDGKTLTVASLQHLLDTTPWEKIPDEYKQILLNGSFNS